MIYAFPVIALGSGLLAGAAACRLLMVIMDWRDHRA